MRAGLDFALTVAGQGYRVLPVASNKRPIMNDWPALATTDPEVIRGWWKRYPEAGVGIAAGHGLVVVDLDVKNGSNGVAEWTEWAAEHGVQWSTTVTTPSGGQHVYFRCADDFSNTVGKVLPGVDVRSAGGQVVAYDVPPPAEALPELPPAAAVLLRGARAREESAERVVGPAGVERALSAEVFHVTIAPENMRNHTLNTAAYNLGQLVGPDGLDEDDVREALTEAATEAGLEPDEIRSTIAGGLRAGKANPRKIVTAPDRAAVDSVGGWRPVDVAALLAGHLTPLEPTLLRRTDGLNLLYPGRTHSLAGESGSGKSWIAQWVAADVLRNRGRVLYLDFESSAASVVARLRSLGCPDEALARLTYVNPGAAPHGEEFEALLMLPYDLAVVDGVTEALAMSGISGDNLTNSNDAVTRWHAMLPKRIAEETGAATVQVDHVTKAKDGRGSYAIGGQAKRASITGAAYVVEAVERFGRGRSGAVALYISKDREGYVLGALEGEESAAGSHVGTVKVISDEGDGSMYLELVPPQIVTREDKHAALMERVSTFLAELPEDHPGAGVAMVKREVTGKDGDIAEALHELVRRGHVERRARGQAQLHRSVTPFLAVFEGVSDV